MWKKLKQWGKFAFRGKNWVNLEKLGKAPQKLAGVITT